MALGGRGEYSKRQLLLAAPPHLFGARGAADAVVQQVQRGLQTLQVGPRKHARRQRLAAHVAAVEVGQRGVQHGRRLRLLPPLPLRHGGTAGCAAGDNGHFCDTAALQGSHGRPQAAEGAVALEDCRSAERPGSSKAPQDDRILNRRSESEERKKGWAGKCSLTRLAGGVR